MPLRRLALGAEGDDGQGEPVEAGDWGKKYPTLVEFLSLASWPEGGKRQLGTMKLFRGPGAWKVMLCDVDAQGVCFVTGDSPEGALRAAERALVDGKGDWRPDKYAGGKGDNRRR